MSVAVSGAPFRPTVFAVSCGFPFREPVTFGSLSLRTRIACSATAGGDEQNRTVDPLLARQVLSQLSYTPVSVRPLNG